VADPDISGEPITVIKHSKVTIRSRYMVMSNSTERGLRIAPFAATIVPWDEALPRISSQGRIGWRRSPADKRPD
jgi:hypothetical protein